jgi:ABC-type Na+ efflux pump permease subunit
MDTFEPPKYLASLISTINDGAKAAQAGALAFILVGLYLLATGFSTTDEDLLLQHATPVSQLGLQVPVVISLAIAPAVFLVLHVFTLIRYDMLAANLCQCQNELAKAVQVEADRERCRHLLANVEFVQVLIARPIRLSTVGCSSTWPGSCWRSSRSSP